MNLHITKSKNAESFYICRSYAKDNGSTTSTIVRKLGTLENLLNRHSPVNTRVAAIFSFTNCQRRNFTANSMHTQVYIANTLHTKYLLSALHRSGSNTLNKVFLEK